MKMANGCSQARGAIVEQPWAIANSTCGGEKTLGAKSIILPWVPWEQPPSGTTICRE